MKCDECKDLIGAFMDNELESSQAADVRMHLAVCLDCVRVCEELSSILNAFQNESASEIVPPNSKALWCRINNIIESEIQPPPPSVTEMPKRRFWHLSLPQLAASVFLVAIVSSLATVIGLRYYTQSPPAEVAGRPSAAPTLFDRVLSKFGVIDTPHQARERRLKEQHAAIEYWNHRVQTRRLQWDRVTRDAFDRNLQVINESVHEYTLTLEKDPEDDLSGEMLDSVLDDKMSLLRDFADL